MLCQHQAINYMIRTLSFTNTLLTLPKRPAWLAHLLFFLHCPWQWFVFGTSLSLPFTLKLHSHSWQPIQRVLRCMISALLLSFPQRYLRAFINGKINLESATLLFLSSLFWTSVFWMIHREAASSAVGPQWSRDSCAAVITT